MAHVQSRDLSHRQRVEVFEKTVAVVTKNYFDPNFNGRDWPRIAQAARESVVKQSDPDAFELAMHDVMRQLGTSHTGFFHQSVRRVPARLAIGATFSRRDVGYGPAWVVHDVHERGPADLAGVRRGDRLAAIDGKPIPADQAPMFPMGARPRVTFRRDSQLLEFDLPTPNPRSRQQPYAEPQAVVAKDLGSGIGYVKVSIFPGLLGLDVARTLDEVFASLSDKQIMLIDLRGHLGGGLGVLRLMSHLTPNKQPIGYTLSRRRAEQHVPKEALPRLDRLPTNLPNPLAIAWLALRYARRDPSVTLVSEGLGAKRWHGSVGILINEHTASAGEMVAAFARENQLARLFGAETAGRLLPGSGYKVGYGYMAILPKAAYITWKGERFEGHGVKPTDPVQEDFDRRDNDEVLETAIAALNG